MNFLTSCEKIIESGCIDLNESNENLNRPTKVNVMGAFDPPIIGGSINDLRCQRTRRQTPAKERNTITRLEESHRLPRK